jgi:hypothetical protein
MRYLRVARREEGRQGAPRSYRGSRKRLRRIRLRGNWSIEFWLYALFILALLFLVLPWLVRSPLSHIH